MLNSRSAAARPSFGLPGGSCRYGCGAQDHDHPGRHIEVCVGGQKLAESDRAMRLDETGLPPRYHIPREDVRADLLRATTRATTCPVKGRTSYRPAQVGDQLHKNLVWSYQPPIPAAGQILGLMCFYNERVELTISDLQQDPTTTASPRYPLPAS